MMITATQIAEVLTDATNRVEASGGGCVDRRAWHIQDGWRYHAHAVVGFIEVTLWRGTDADYGKPNVAEFTYRLDTGMLSSGDWDLYDSRNVELAWIPTGE